MNYSIRFPLRQFPPTYRRYAQTCINNANARVFQSRNAMIDFGIDALKDHTRETPGVRREATHDINRMNIEKVIASEASYNQAA